MIKTPREKVIKIVNLVIDQYGLSDNFIISGFIKTFIKNIDELPEEEINNIFFSIKKIIDEK